MTMAQVNSKSFAKLYTNQGINQPGTELPPDNDGGKQGESLSKLTEGPSLKTNKIHESSNCCNRSLDSRSNDKEEKMKNENHSLIEPNFNDSLECDKNNDLQTLKFVIDNDGKYSVFYFNRP